MPDSDKAAAEPAKAAPAGSSEGLISRLGELAWKALPAIGSAIGFVGFVAIVGGAIEWIRFDTANLPATQAVLAVPKQELVVIGALALGVFVIGAILAVLVVYLIDSDGNATPRTAYGLIAVGVAEMAVTLFFIGHHGPLKYIWLGLWLILILFATGYFVGLVMRDFRRRTKVKQARSRVLRAGEELANAKDAYDAVGVSTANSKSAASQTARLESHREAARALEAFERAIGEWSTAAGRVTELQLQEQDGGSTGKETRAQRNRPADKGDEPSGPDDESDKRRGMPEKIRERAKTVEDLPPKELIGRAPGRVEIEAKLDEAERWLGHVYRAAVGQAVDGLSARTGENRGGAKGDDGNRLLLGVVLGALALGAAILIAIGFAIFVDEVTWAAILFIAVALLTAMNVFVARATDKFGLYGVAVFFSVLMFGAGLTIARTLHEPKVQPVALLRKGNEVGVCGVYITQTNDRVYVGRLPLQGQRPGLIFWVPTSDVDIVSVGQPERIGGPRSFAKSAESLLARLYKDRAEEAAPVLKNTTTTKVVGDASSPKGQTTTMSETPPPTERSRRHPNVKIYEKSCTSTQAVDP